jgi:hypothetical protein
MTDIQVPDKHGGMLSGAAAFNSQNSGRLWTLQSWSSLEFFILDDHDNSIGSGAGLPYSRLLLLMARPLRPVGL